MSTFNESLQLSKLIDLLKRSINSFPDKRKGNNCQYSLQDISLAGLSVFFTQSPSFLAHQKAMKKSKGISNANTIFGLDKIPTDNHVRSILDHVSPDHLNTLFDELVVKLNKEAVLDKFRSFNNELLIAIDGTQYYTSKTISCQKCSKRDHKNGETDYYHSLLAPAIISPKLRKALALAPEFLSPQENSKKQDHELMAAKRWLLRMGKHLAPLHTTILGDDLFAKQPLCIAITEQKLNYLLVCKPKSHKWLYDWVEQSELNTIMKKHREKGKVRTYRYRFTSNVPLRDTKDALLVNWAEILITDTKGKQIYKNAFITNHEINEGNIESLIESGRARWKIENENNNTLKTKGYHLEHNFGHGKEYLSQTLAVLNILAFLFHTILSFTDKRYQLIRATLPRRDMFFQDIAALFRYMSFRDWNHLLKHMISSLELEDPG